MQVVTHNLSAMNASRQLNIVTKNQQKSSEKLASGYRINRAADDAAGLSISEKMRRQIRGLDRGAQNIEEGISYVQVADGALNEVHAILHRINELAVQSANGTNSDDDRDAINEEVKQLKTEMQRIFETTTFNEKQIWPEESITRVPVKIGEIDVKGVKITTPSSQEIEINNTNFDVVAKDDYTIHADQNGVRISWKGFNNKSYESTVISWDKLEENGYAFQIAEYFNLSDTELFDNGTPVFDFKVAFSPEKEASVQDMIDAIDGVEMWCYEGTYITARFEDATGTEVSTSGVRVSGSITYPAAYDSKMNQDGYDFENPEDGFFEPVLSNGTNLKVPSAADITQARTSTEGWEFTFELDGVGQVVAKSKSVTSYSDERRAEVQGKWWKSYKDTDGTYKKYGVGLESITYGKGTLGSFIDLLEGNVNSNTPGLLSSEGVTNQGGSISISFDLSANGNNVGTMTITVEVDPAEDINDVYKKLTDALNDNTIVDYYTTQNNIDSAYQNVNPRKENEVLVKRDVFQDDLYCGEVDLNIHSGPSSNDSILLNYRCLRVEALNMRDTDVLTEDTARDMIDSVGKAIEIVSKERSRFGAYQNRLEHAKKVNENTSENTSAAESRIRDTEMEEEMVRYSKENILISAGQSMLAQANASTQGVLTLIK